ncbi:MAG: DUF1638 domain-containing protein [Lentisphaerae bacterium]|nr:DUF1638 domain-containing protein [Lentisphaerota bacterium]
MSRYTVIGCHVLWRELSRSALREQHDYDFRFLRQGLHDQPDQLRTQVQEAIDLVREGRDAILVGYGLCSNGLQGIEARHTPLVIPRAHDCITLLLGSRQRYQEYFDAHPGTYWYSSGWIETNPQPGQSRCELLKKHYSDQYGEENADYLMEMEQGWMKDYTTAAYIDPDAAGPTRYRAHTMECADSLEWEYREVPGSDNLVRRFLAGDWDDDFLIVQPGQRIIPTHDAGIIGVEG